MHEGSAAASQTLHSVLAARLQISFPPSITKAEASAAITASTDSSRANRATPTAQVTTLLKHSTHHTKEQVEAMSLEQASAFISQSVKKTAERISNIFGRYEDAKKPGQPPPSPAGLGVSS